MNKRRWRFLTEDGPPILYFGRYRGARYISVDVKGFNGWQSSRRMPGGWEYWKPTVYYGRLFMDRGGHYTIGTVLFPAKLMYLWRMATSRAYREASKHVETPAPLSD